MQRVGAVGYCFGGKYVVRGLGEGGGVDVGILCHPSFVEEGELEGVKGPVGVAAAGKCLFEGFSLFKGVGVGRGGEICVW